MSNSNKDVQHQNSSKCKALDVKEKESRSINVKEKNQKRVETKLTDLPPEILINILKHLSRLDLMRNVSRISKQFYVLSQDFQVPLSGTFKIRSWTPLSFVRKLLQRSHQIVRLDLITTATTPTFTLLKTSLKFFTRLKSLQINPNDYDMAGYGSLDYKEQLLQNRWDGQYENIRECRSLEHLWIWQTPLTLLEFNSFSSLVHLKTFEVALSAEIQLEDITRVLSKLTKITKLTLDQIPLIGNKDLDSIVKACPSLENLSLIGLYKRSGFTASGLKRTFQENKKLIEFNFYSLCSLPPLNFIKEDFPSFKIKFDFENISNFIYIVEKERAMKKGYHILN